MLEALVLWNEPNNLSHWNFGLDPEWRKFSEMVKLASTAIREVNPSIPIVLGGISACDSDFLRLIDSWPERVSESEDASGKPVWVTEVGASSFGSEEVQRFGLERSLTLLRGLTNRVHWYSLYDLPPAWPAETRHKEAEGSAYYRHYYLGLLRSDGSPKLSAQSFPTDGSIGLAQWFHFEDHRLDDAVTWMKAHGVRYLRTGLSWADSYRPQATQWFDRQMEALAPFQVALTLCFTPAHLGIEGHHTSPPWDLQTFAEFARWVANRYAPRSIVADTNLIVEGEAVTR